MQRFVFIATSRMKVGSSSLLRALVMVALPREAGAKPLLHQHVDLPARRALGARFQMSSVSDADRAREQQISMVCCASRTSAGTSESR